MAEKKRNLTVFQRLNNIFGPEGVNVPKNQTNRYNIGNQELLKTQSKEEFETAKLQAQQNKYISGLWSRVDGEMYQQAIHYETTRIGSYADFEAMEFYPEISAALDIMMEEATTPNDKGQVVNIYSDSKRVKSILEDLFKNRLDIHTSLPMWTRNTCKYGDNFVYLNIDDKAGIIGARQMPNFEVERREGNLYDALAARGRSTYKTTGTEYDNRVRFYWKTKDIEFNSWQMAHFRLLGDDRKLPYGTSILEKARRIWKQLLLSEDAMLVYRVTRAPERRVYKVFVGNIDNEDVPSYVNEIANRFKRSPLIDSKTGQIDLRYNQLGYDQDIFIPVRDENAPNPIDTLPGAQNLDQIADIEYLQRKLFTALRVPKSFLGFEEAVGEGKNLALQDIRFSRTVNRVQQAMIQELNKIAIIHLYLLGFEEDLDNFTITLNNPSTQAEMLKIEHMQQKFTAYKDAVSDAGNGFAIMSMTRGKREILGWSDDDIKQDILEQRIEKAAAAELDNTSSVIKYTGFFDKVDKLYGDIEIARKGGGGAEGEAGAEGGGAAGGGGGFAGGGPIGGEDLDFGDEGDLGAEGGAADFGGAEAGAEPNAEAGAEPNAEIGAEAGAEPKAESIARAEKILTEQKQRLVAERKLKEIRYRGNYIDKLTESIKPNQKDFEEKTKITDRNLKINEDINSMINEIDKKLGE
jgi:hypothetical protein